MTAHHLKGRPQSPCPDIAGAQPLIERLWFGVSEGIDFSLASTAKDKRLQRILNCRMAGNRSHLLCRELRRLLRCLFQILRANIASRLTGGLSCVLGGNAGHIGRLD